MIIEFKCFICVFRLVYRVFYNIAFVIEIQMLKKQNIIYVKSHLLNNVSGELGGYVSLS